MNYKKTALTVVLIAAVQFFTPTTYAADPLANCADGVPFRWADGGVGIPFNPDQGALGPLDNAGAIAQVALSFDAWEQIPSSTVSYVNAGILPVDVDITNFGPYLNATAPDGQSAIVFDDTGEIFELLYGPDTGVLGFAGPEFIDSSTCTILEGLSFLNGPSFEPDEGGDPADAIESATDVMVHEFGHYSNLAHVQVNGSIALSADEATGPNPDNDTFPIDFPGAFFNDNILETMYPFYFGPGLGTQSPAADDISSISALYPAADYTSTTVAISGSVRAPNGTTRISGVNVIARNVNDPFSDAVSAISGGFTDATDSGSSDVVGTFTITGLTPGEQYALFIDDLGLTTAAGGAFSTGALTPLPGPEEYWNGASESSNPAVDDPLMFEAISGSAGETVAGVDVIVNEPQPGQPLDVGDDGSVLLFLDFPFDFCGVRHESLFVNANGDISFVAPNGDFSESTPEFLSGAPRIAGIWDDLDPTSGGTVTFQKTDWSYTIIYDEIPEWGTDNANSFKITLFRKGPWALEQGTKNGSAFKVKYGEVAATDGIAGYSCGANGTSGFEDEERNLRKRWYYPNNYAQPGARFEQFTGNGEASESPNLSYRGILYAGANGLSDTYERNKTNNTVADGTWINLPFDSSRQVTTLSPDGDDIDFFRFNAKAGEVLAIEVVRTHNDDLNLGLDTVIGLFNADTGELLASDDDGGYVGGLGFAGLSRLIVQVPENLKLAVGVTTFPDLGFTGAGGIGGRYVLSVRKYPAPDYVLNFPDESFFELPLPYGFKFHGTNWDSVFINSNGHLTFGEENALSFIPNVPDFLAGPPRIAPLWDDFEPDGALGGGVPGLILVNTDNNSTAVHWVSVSQFIPTGPSYFSVDLQRNGKAEIDIGATTRELGQFGTTIVGLTEGGGASDPGASDLSWRRHFSAGKTVYENFEFPGFITPSTFDLYFKKIRAYPAPKPE